MRELFGLTRSTPPGQYPRPVQRGRLRAAHGEQAWYCDRYPRSRQAGCLGMCVSPWQSKGRGARRRTVPGRGWGWGLLLRARVRACECVCARARMCACVRARARTCPCRCSCAQCLSARPARKGGLPAGPCRPSLQTELPARRRTRPNRIGAAGRPRARW